ncbi:hypothetical protein BDV98DRAFT_606448 [Pterulicium gracile]|uniref:Uncharacterized protein n=1 Tax=Pterulicium gracile TaxID=1884261 RepID=A0A5C3QB52_9AGAR|nr:hypothetical protein BDV98DRAFT_606448 [Pterula gracilis]
MKLPFQTIAVFAVLGSTLPAVLGAPVVAGELEARNPQRYRGGGGGSAAAAAAASGGRGGSAAAAAAASGGRGGRGGRRYRRDTNDNYFVFFDGINDGGKKGWYQYTDSGIKKIDYDPSKRFRLNFFPFFGNYGNNVNTSGSSSPFSGNFNPFSIFRNFPF